MGFSKQLKAKGLSCLCFSQAIHIFFSSDSHFFLKRYFPRALQPVWRVASRRGRTHTERSSRMACRKLLCGGNVWDFDGEACGIGKKFPVFVRPFR